jgi:hypothetical protein
MVVASSVPIVLAVATIGVWLLAWWELGHPPRPSIDDPKQIRSLRFLYLPVVLLVVLVPPGLFVALVAIVWDLVWPRGDRGWLRVVLPLLVWVGFFAWVRYDPGQILVWLGD